MKHDFVINPLNKLSNTTNQRERFRNLNEPLELEFINLAKIDELE